jgi:hypothetical protein
MARLRFTVRRFRVVVRMKNGAQLVRDLALYGGRTVEQGINMGIDSAGRLGGLALNMISRRGLSPAPLRAVRVAVEVVHRASPAAAQAAGRLVAFSILLGGSGGLAAGQLALLSLLRLSRGGALLLPRGVRAAP